MDIADFVWLIAIAFWLFSGLISRFGGALRKAQRRKETQAQQPARQPARRPMIEQRKVAQQGSVPPPLPPDPARELEKAFKELVANVGLDGPEHRRTPSEHRQQESERSLVLGEHTPTASEHERSAGELRRTKSELVPTPGEHRQTLSEHLAGDALVVPGRLSKPQKVRSRTRSARARRVERMLTNRGTLADAIVLREILGPAPGLDSPRR